MDPGLGGPDNLGVLVAMGVDLFDLARCREAAANSVLLTMGGPRRPLDHEGTTLEAQAYHMMKAIDEARAAVSSGTLRQLAARQSQSSPRAVEHFRRHQDLVSQHRGNLASHRPSTTEFPCFTSDALNDPLVVDWERFMRAVSHAGSGSSGDDPPSVLCPQAVPAFEISRPISSGHRFNRVSRGDDDFAARPRAAGP